VGVVGAGDSEVADHVAAAVEFAGKGSVRARTDGVVAQSAVPMHGIRGVNVGGEHVVPVKRVCGLLADDAQPAALSSGIMRRNLG